MSYDGTKAMHDLPTAASTASVIAAWMGWLPPVLTAVATLFAIVWYAIMIYDWIDARGAKRGKTQERNHPNVE